MAAPAAPESGQRSIPAAYKVQRGQSLWSIAADELGSGSRYIEILDLNPQLQGDPGRIVPGQELTLPAPVKLACRQLTSGMIGYAMLALLRLDGGSRITGLWPGDTSMARGLDLLPATRTTVHPRLVP